MDVDVEYYIAARTHAEEMLEKGNNEVDVLQYLVSAAESGAGQGAVASILQLDEEGLLRNASSPHLPADYLKAIDRLKPDAKLGTCASAAATGSVVITTDFQADDKWAELKHLPLALGFHGAWSFPIKRGGRVIGTFGTYYREKRNPSNIELKGVEMLAEVAAKILSRNHNINN